MRKNFVIFVRMRDEWMVEAHACFKPNLTIVKIYLTLGDNAVAHGIKWMEVGTVITSQELLPKFKKFP